MISYRRCPDCGKASRRLSYREEDDIPTYAGNTKELDDYDATDFLTEES